MGILDKIMFWKKKGDEDFGLPNLPEAGGPPGSQAPDDLGLPELGPAPGPPSTPPKPFETQDRPPAFAEPTTPSPHEPRMQPPMMPTHPAPMGSNPQLEVINSKLDALKAILSSVEQRIASLERISHEKREW